MGALRLDDDNGEAVVEHANGQRTPTASHSPPTPAVLALVDEIEESKASENEIEVPEKAPEVPRKVPEAQEVEPEQEKENFESGGNQATNPVVQMNQEVGSTVSAPLGPCPRKSIPFTLPDEGDTADRFQYLATHSVNWRFDKPWDGG